MSTDSYTPTVWSSESLVVCESNAGHIAFVSGAWAAILPPISTHDRGIAGTLLQSLWNAADWIDEYVAGDPEERLVSAAAVTEWAVIAERTDSKTVVIYPCAMGRSGSIFAFGLEGTNP